MKKIFITFAILLFSISTVNAGTVYGYLPCGTFLNDCEQSKLNIDCQTQTYFALGYISAYAAQDDVTFSNGIFNSDNIKYALIKYCRENPLKDTHLGAVNIFYQMK